MLRSIFLWISLLIMAAAPVFAVDGDTVTNADELAAAGNYDAAITEYKRFVCFHPGDDRISAVQIKIGKAYWELGDRQKSMDQYLKAVENAPTDLERDATRIDLAVMYLASKEYNSAEAILLRVTTFSADINAKRRALFCLAICHLYLSKWDEAQQELNVYFEGRDAKELENLTTLLSPASRPGGKSRNIARWLSTFVPGLGQMYAGHYGDGINALCVNAFFGKVLHGAIRRGSILDVSSEVPFFLRYYNGNRDNAAQQVDKYNERLNKRYAQQITETLKTITQPSPQLNK